MSKKIITNKQKIIQTLLYTFRFLNSKQIQKFLQHKDHRRINKWLKDLSDKQYIERDFKPIFGTLTKPAVYNLAAKGRGYIRNAYTYHFPRYLKRIARDNKASKSFRIRCQIIADYYLLLFPPEQRNNQAKTTIGIDIIDHLVIQLTTDMDEKKEKIPMNTLQFFTPAYFPPFVLLEGIKPDAYIRKRTTRGIRHTFLFVIDAYIPRFLLRYSLKHIFDTLDEEYWEDESIHSLQFYFLCPNHKIIIYLRRTLPSFLENYYGSHEIIFYFGTRNQLYEGLKNPEKEIKWITISSKEK